MELSPYIRRSSRRTRRVTRYSWFWARGITARRSMTAARSVPSNSTAIPRFTSAARFCGRSSTSTSRTARPRPACRPSLRSKQGRTRGDACPPGRPANRRRSISAPVSSSVLPAPGAGDPAFDEYVSDPAKPVPFRQRPIGDDKRQTWSQWLVDDQREESGRPDVIAYVSDELSAPVKISGQPVANLIASTSGTDSDWVVKVIDLYPDEVAGQPALGGYQLMVSADIFRGRYRESLETAREIESDKPLLYRFALPTANHVFLKGHRIMVQVQSSWFPLYDRNPQTFVPNIFWAKAGDYRKAVQRVYHGADQASFVELPLVKLP